jgi:hypothetical protein
LNCELRIRNGEFAIRNSQFLIPSLPSAICNLLKEIVMGAYDLEEVVRRWQQGRLTTEQAVGQMLLLLCGFEERLQELERRFAAEAKRGAP